jgi:Flp pilus assembly protein TadG
MTGCRPPLARRARLGDRDSGLASIELVILLPAFVLLILLATYLGRTNVAQSSVDGAAQDAARAASLERDSTSAQAAALQAVQQNLETTGSPCEPTTATVTITNLTATSDPFDTPLGTPAQVDVLVTCKVYLADLIFPGLPIKSEVTITSTFASPIDEYRLRTTPSAPAP